MTHDTHLPPGNHDHHAAAFQDDRMAALLETEGELASTLTQQAIALCTDLLDINHTDVRRLIDLGCGPGVATVQLAESFEKATVIGVDGSPVMLEHAVNRATRHGVSNRVDLRLLNLNDELRTLGTFDLVWVALALHHTASEQDALDNFAALIRPQGLLCLIERAEADVRSYTGMLERAGLELLDSRTLTHADGCNAGISRDETRSTPTRTLFIARQAGGRS